MTWLMWNLVLVHSMMVLVSEQDRCTACTKRTNGSENYFRRTQWYSYLMRLKWKLVLFHLEIVLTLTQDRCTVCTECTTDLEIILGALDEIPR
jgi:hypothetical protein